MGAAIDAGVNQQVTVHRERSGGTQHDMRASCNFLNPTRIVPVRNQQRYVCA